MRWRAGEGGHSIACVGMVRSVRGVVRGRGGENASCVGRCWARVSVRARGEEVHDMLWGGAARLGGEGRWWGGELGGRHGWAGTWEEVVVGV